MKKNQFAAFLLALLLFGSGAAVGALAHRYWTETTVNAKENFRQHYLAEMQSKLKLSPEQTKQLEGIMDQTKAKYKAVHAANEPTLRQIKAEHIHQVQAILTPQQLPIYAQLVAEHERRAREMEH